MLRPHLHDVHDEFDSDGFRLRGLGFSRLDGFSDVVFGFALTLIVVSLEVPKSFSELHHLWAAFLPFGITFLLLMLIWYEHFVFFRRFGTHDVGTIWLNGLLLFVVLFYVYPLKFLFLSAFNGSPDQSGSMNWRELVVVFSCGQATLYLLLAALYANGYRQRKRLLLTPIEVFLTRTFILDEAGAGVVGLMVCCAALLLPRAHASTACLLFMAIGVLRTLTGRYARIGADRIRAGESKTSHLSVAESPADAASIAVE